MRKRSKYRPKRNLLNPVGFVLEGLIPVREHSSFMVDLKIKNHGAMTALLRGQATRDDIYDLINMVNVCEALYRLGFGTEYGDVVKTALVALRDAARRGADTDKFILRASEIKALNDVMELHDAQMDVIVLKDMERAVDMVREEQRLKRTVKILGETP